MEILNEQTSKHDTILDTTAKKKTPIRTLISSMESKKRVTQALKQTKMPSTYSIQPRVGRHRQDGKSKLYLSIYINKKRIRQPLEIWVPVKKWDANKQIVTGRSVDAKDCNLAIEAQKARINDILIEMRLNKIPITEEAFLNKWLVKSSNGDFTLFWERELDRQKGFIQNSTLRQQRAILSKLKDFMPVIPFTHLNIKLVESWISWMRISRNNTDTTIYVALKSFRKYVNLAKREGYTFSLKSKEIKIKSTISMRTFLSRSELKRMHLFFFSDECYGVQKDALRKFLFSCYTGLRISDVHAINKNDIDGDMIFFQSKKAQKVQRFALSKKALLFLQDTDQFGNIFAGTKCPVVINRQLKDISKKLKIKKNISFHCSRHTFATQFLELGGDVTVLQKLLGHSSIRETMTYVHITPVRKSAGTKLFDQLKY